MNMNADAHIQVVLEVFAAIEQRDAARFQAHTHPGVTICWPPSLPWNAGVPGRLDEDGHHALSWLEVWAPLQPTAAERQMDPESSPPPTTGSWCSGASGDAALPGCALTARCWACTRSGGSGWPAPRCSISTPTRSGASSLTPTADNRVARCPGSRRLTPVVGDGAGGAREGRAHPNVRLLEAFYQAQAAFYAGGDDTADLRGLLADDIAWHVSGRSPIAGHYHGHHEVLGYFAARRAHAKATFRVLPRAVLADDQRAVQLADGQLERDGQLRTWQTRPSGCSSTA